MPLFHSRAEVCVGNSVFSRTTFLSKEGEGRRKTCGGHFLCARFCPEQSGVILITFQGGRPSSPMSLGEMEIPRR